MSYYTTITNAGLAQIATAIAAGEQLDLVQMAVGDGNGIPVNPLPTQTALVREVYRGPVNQISANTSGRLVAEFVIPYNVGGFTVREIGIFDADGVLFALGSLPPLPKPLLTDNTAGELVLRMVIAVDSIGAINLLIDPGVVLATQQWVEVNFAPSSLLPGGTTGQILTKKSNLDGDTEWVDPAGVSVVVDTIEESQTLAAGQVVVDLVTATTNGLAVYIDGLRIPKSAWSPTTINRITLAQSYAAGTVLTAVQNAPAASIELIKVGQIIMLGLASDPVQVFGYGTWARVAEGRALFGFDGTDPDHNGIGKIGGSKTHTHTGTTATAGQHNHQGITSLGGNHNHGGETGDTSLSVDQMPPHAHQYRDRYYIENNSVLTNATNKEATPLFYNGGYGSRSTDQDNNQFLFIESTTAQNGQGEGHSHTIPSSGTHAHNIGNDGIHSHNLTTNAGSSLPPYYTVALWQRTA